jgi:AraC family transcriptional activator of tynA and feaB
MRKIFSTDEIGVRDKFRSWQEISRELLPPFEMRQLGEGVFHARWETAAIGGLLVSSTAFGAHRTTTNSSTIRQNEKQSKLVIAFRFEGAARCRQYDRALVEQPGSLTVLDNNAPLDLEFNTPMRSLRIELPRERLECTLGPARLFAALPIDSELPGASLARTFFGELARVNDKLSPELAERMSNVGVDLLIAAVSERMAQETSKPIQSTVLVQRAKVYVEANLGDPELDPPQLAAAVGVSLRRLQELFHERGQHISDYIWHRRLEAASKRLTDPGCVHISSACCPMAVVSRARPISPGASRTATA